MLSVFCVVVVITMLFSRLANPFRANCVKHRPCFQRLIATGIKAIEDDVYSFLTTYVELDNNTNIILCVSGGIDSMAMLHIFAALKNKRKQDFNLHIISFNHKVRAEADEEIQFVSRCAKEYDIPFFTIELPIMFRTISGFQSFSRSWRRKECLQLADDIRGKYFYDCKEGIKPKVAVAMTIQQLNILYL